MCHVPTNTSFSMLPQAFCLSAHRTTPVGVLKLFFAMVIFRELPSEGSNIAHIPFQPLRTAFRVTLMEPNDPNSDGGAPGPTVWFLHSEQDARGGRERKKGGSTNRKCYARMVSKANITRFSRSRRLLLATAYTGRALRQAEGEDGWFLGLRMNYPIFQPSQPGSSRRDEPCLYMLCVAAGGEGEDSSSSLSCQTRGLHRGLTAAEVQARPPG